MTKEQQALELWREWIDFNDEFQPLAFDREDGWTCIFCGDEGRWNEPTTHKPDCVYVLAKALLAQD